MPIFVTLYKFTEQGFRNIKDSPQRLSAGLKSFESRGGKVLGAYYTMGEYDLVVIGEIADEQAGMANALAQASLGNVRSTTLCGYTPSEFSEIIRKM